MRKFLFFDCETNGLPIDYKASYEDVNNWPRVLSLGWILADESATVINRAYHLIQPNGWQVPTEEFWTRNGYTQARCEAEGVPITSVLEQFYVDKARADVLVAHNINFDHRIVWAEFIRNSLQPRSGMLKICTMMKSTAYCRLPGKGGRPKWPKLEELYRHLFKKEIDGAHNAGADVEACMQSFFELVRLGVITLENRDALV